MASSSKSSAAWGAVLKSGRSLEDTEIPSSWEALRTEYQQGKTGLRWVMQEGKLMSRGRQLAMVGSKPTQGPMGGCLIRRGHGGAVSFLPGKRGWSETQLFSSSQTPKLWSWASQAVSPAWRPTASPSYDHGTQRYPCRDSRMTILFQKPRGRSDNMKLQKVLYQDLLGWVQR